MGLDMFVWRVKDANVIDEFHFEKDENESRNKLFYWRKHHDLHGWMENLYRAKGGTAESFNCVPVQLTSYDLDKLQNDLLMNMLPRTSGFFFGDNPPDDESLKNDLKFILMARDAIDEGDAVYYDSWW